MCVCFRLNKVCVISNICSYHKTRCVILLGKQTTAAIIVALYYLTLFVSFGGKLLFLNYGGSVVAGTGGSMWFYAQMSGNK